MSKNTLLIRILKQRALKFKTQMTSNDGYHIGVFYKADNAREPSMYSLPYLAENFERIGKKFRCLLEC